MNRKRKFKAQDNPFKIYHQAHTKEEVKQAAEQYRSQHLANPTNAELAFENMLKKLEVAYEKEHILYYANGYRFIIVDFWLTGKRIAVEIDGSVHLKQQEYDRQRDSWLASNGILPVRFSNKEVLYAPDAVNAKLKEILCRA